VSWMVSSKASPVRFAIPISFVGGLAKVASLARGHNKPPRTLN
jgi:hypothetical protein